MPGQSLKEQCFNTAVATLQALRKQAGDPLPYRIDTQMPWTKTFAAGAGKWMPVEAGPFKQWYYIYGYLKNKLGAGPFQVRYPDATITYGDGSRQVMDCKFTRADGRADTWGTDPGKFSRRTQLEDYNEINTEQGHPTLGPPELSRKSCECDKKEKEKQLQPKPVLIPEFVPAPGFYMVPSPLAPGTYMPPLWNPNPVPLFRPFPIPVMP